MSNNLTWKKCFVSSWIQQPSLKNYRNLSIKQQTLDQLYQTVTNHNASWKHVAKIKLAFIETKVQERLVDHKNCHGNDKKEQTEDETYWTLSGVISSPIGCHKRYQYLTDIVLRNGDLRQCNQTTELLSIEARRVFYNVI